MDIETRPDDTKMKVAVCGWSYRMSAAHVAEEMRKIGVRTVDLAACPFVDPKAVLPNTGVETELVAGTGGTDPIAKERDDIEALLASGEWTVSSTLFNSRYDDYSTLAPWIRHIHVKDAWYAKVPGTWGKEAVWTQGDVHADAFVAALREIGFGGVLSVEREAGNDRAGDIARAVADLKGRGIPA